MSWCVPGPSERTDGTGLIIPGGGTPVEKTGVMAFGQQAGPPASARQVQELSELVRAAGHEGFREARHPLGLNQRQAGGRFTRDEADDLISRLQSTNEDESGSEESPAKIFVESPRVDAAQKVLRVMPADQLAIELERRGWTVIPP
jgi:hypothetical protein